MKLFAFFKYNNAVPITLSVVLLGAGSAFAATDPQAIYSAQQTVTTPDNTYIATVDLNTYTPQIQITGVTEDADTYHVAYTLSTIDIKDAVWQDVTKDGTLTVSKQDLGTEDLGLYATKQFKNIIANELAYLSQVQEKARANITQETVATTYGGLIGKMLSDSTQTLPGYVPVVQTPTPAPAAVISSVSQIQPPIPTQTLPTSAGVGTPTASVGAAAPTMPAADTMLTQKTISAPTTQTPTPTSYKTDPYREPPE